MDNNPAPPGWDNLVDVQVGQKYGHWEVYAELDKEQHSKPRHRHGGVTRPRMFLMRCVQCADLREVKANEVRRYKKRQRNPDLVLKCKCNE